MTYGVDRHCWGIDLDSSNNTIVWTEGGTRHEASISAGTYHYYFDSALNTDFDTFPGELQAALNSSGDPGFTVRSHTPSGSGLVESGVEVSAEVNWAWSFSDSAFDLNPRYLGYGKSPSDPSEALTQTSPYSAWGFWQSHNLTSSRAADKRDDFVRDLETSREEAEDAFQLEFGAQRHLRTFEYLEVPAAHVRRLRADDADYADFGEVPTGDINNALFDLHEHAYDLSEVLVIHDDGDNADFGLNNSRTPYEGYKLDSLEQRQRFEAMIADDEMEGERYTVQWDAVITTVGDYNF